MSAIRTVTFLTPVRLLGDRVDILRTSEGAKLTFETIEGLQGIRCEVGGIARWVSLGNCAVELETAANPAPTQKKPAKPTTKP